MSARHGRPQHKQYGAPNNSSFTQRGSSSLTRLSDMESMLDRFCSSTCSLVDWADAKERTSAFMDLVKEIQYKPTAWPQWLVPKLTAAINKALQNSILGLAGPEPANSFICQPYGIDNHNKKQTALDGYTSIGQLMSSLARLYRVVYYDESPEVTGQYKPTMQTAFLRQGLLANMAAAGNNLATFLSTHNILHWETDKKKHPDHIYLQGYVPFAMVGLAGQLINLWLVVNAAMPFIPPGAPLDCLQTMARLSSLILSAWPGPNLLAGWQNRTASPAAAAAEAASKQGRESAAYQFQNKELPVAVSFAAQLAASVYELSSRSFGEPCKDYIKSELAKPVLEVLASAEVHHVLQVGVMVSVYNLHEEYFDSKAGIRGSKSGNAGRLATTDGKAASAKMIDALDKLSPANAPRWHEQLARVLNLEGSLQLLAVPVARGQDTLRFSTTAMALTICAAAHEKLTGSSPMRSAMASDLHLALYLTVTEGLLLQPHLVMHMCLYPLLEELVVSAGRDATKQHLREQMLEPLLCHLTPQLSSILREAKKTGSFANNGALLADAEDASQVLGSIADRLGGCCNCLLTPGTHSIKDYGLAPSARCNAALAAAPRNFVVPVCRLIAQQPAQVLKSLEALARLQGVSICNQRNLESVHKAVEWFLPSPIAVQAVDLLSASEQLLVHMINHNQDAGADTAAGEGIMLLLLADSKGASAAWLGCLASWAKNAAWALQETPYTAGLNVMGAAAAQLSALSALCSAASTTGVRAGSSTSFNTEGAVAAQKLGALALPVVMAAARALLLVAGVLALPADQCNWQSGKPRRSSPDAKGSLQFHMLMPRNLERLVGPAHTSSFDCAAALQACLQGVHFITKLLPHMPPVPLTEKGATAKVSSKATHKVAAPGMPALLPDTLQLLLLQAEACASALQQVAASFEADPQADGPGLSHTSRSGASSRGEDCGLLGQMLEQLQALSCNDHTGPATEPSPACNHSGSSSARDGSQGSTGSIAGLCKQLHGFAESLLSALPSFKVCANPECVGLNKLSERELCVRQCSACGTAYCSKECSQEHWKSHKALCRRLAAAKQGNQYGHPSDTAEAPAAAPAGKKGKSKAKGKATAPPAPDAPADQADPVASAAAAATHAAPVEQPFKADPAAFTAAAAAFTFTTGQAANSPSKASRSPSKAGRMHRAPRPGDIQWFG